jgi:hypothetical protein
MASLNHAAQVLATAARAEIVGAMESNDFSVGSKAATFDHLDRAKQLLDAAIALNEVTDQEQAES